MRRNKEPYLQFWMPKIQKIFSGFFFYFHQSTVGNILAYRTCFKLFSNHLKPYIKTCLITNILELNFLNIFKKNLFRDNVHHEISTTNVNRLCFSRFSLLPMYFFNSYLSLHFSNFICLIIYICTFKIQISAWNVKHFSPNLLIINCSIVLQYQLALSQMHTV